MNPDDFIWKPILDETVRPEHLTLPGNMEPGCTVPTFKMELIKDAVPFDISPPESFADFKQHLDGKIIEAMGIPADLFCGTPSPYGYTNACTTGAPCGKVTVRSLTEAFWLCKLKLLCSQSVDEICEHIRGTW